MGGHNRRQDLFFIPEWVAGAKVAPKGSKNSFDYLRCIVMLLACVLGQSCISADEAIKLGRNSVEEFRSQWRERNYRQIYLGADQAFRERVSEEDFTAFGTNIQAQLGDLKRSTLIEERVDYSDAGTIVIHRFETKFVRGAASEQLAWLLKGGKSYLYNYAINISLPIGLDKPPPAVNDRSVP